MRKMNLKEYLREKELIKLWDETSQLSKTDITPTDEDREKIEELL